MSVQLETRDILNSSGVVIGQLSLPITSTESEWANALAIYAQPPPGMPEIVYDKISSYRRLAPNLLTELYRDNTLAGITVQQSDQMFDEYFDVLLRIKEGCFPTAIYRLQQKTPSGFVTQDMINSWIRKIQAYL